LGREIHEQRDYSEKVAEKIDEEIASFIRQGEDKASIIIEKHRDYLEKIVAVLLKQEVIEKTEFENIVGAKVLS